MKGNCTFVAMAVGPHTTVGKINMQVLGLKIEGDDEEEGYSVEKKADSEDGAAEAGDDDAGKSLWRGSWRRWPSTSPSLALPLRRSVPSLPPSFGLF